MKIAHIQNGFIYNIEIHNSIPENTDISSYLELDEAILLGYTSKPIDVNLFRQDVLSQIDNKTSSKILEGYQYSGKTFSSSNNHQTWALGVIIGTQVGQDFSGIIIPTIDNLDSYTIIDNADAVTMASACISHVKNLLSSGSILKNQAVLSLSKIELDNVIVLNSQR